MGRGGRNKSKRRKVGSKTLEHKLLLEYLRDYKQLVLSRYEAASFYAMLPKSAEQNAHLTQDCGRGSQRIEIDGVPLPALDDPNLLEQPYLELPKELSSYHRALVHDICTDMVHLFHCGVNGSAPGERFVLVSVYSDGLSHAPEIAQANYQPSAYEEHKPWIMKQNLDTKAETERQKKLIWDLIDQPGRCLRDDYDTIDLQQTDDLSEIQPPQTGDPNCMLIDSVEMMEQCILELSLEKPRELAFDLECYNRLKGYQMTCLIQLCCDDGRTYVIDVLADGVWDKVCGLAPIFADTSIVKIGHGIRGLDVQSLQRDFGIFVHNAFDTYEAATVLKLEGLGLAHICNHYKLQTSSLYSDLKQNYQATDWTKRPLSEPMILYGRYDVHYLIHLRRLMTRDLVRMTITHDPNDFMSFSLQEMICLMNQEDGVEEDLILQAPTDEMETKKEIHTVLGASELRMIPGLMTVLTNSQQHCLKFWNCTPESPLKNKRFVELARTNGKGFSKSQLNLYHELALWREEVAIEEEALPGRICSLDFLARVAYHRPLSEDGLRNILYFLPRFLTKRNKHYMDALFFMVKNSRKDDNAVDDESYASFNELQKRKARKEMMHMFSGKGENVVSSPIFWVVSCATISLLIYSYLGDRRRRHPS